MVFRSIIQSDPEISAHFSRVNARVLKGNLFQEFLTALIFTRHMNVLMQMLPAVMACLMMLSQLCEISGCNGDECRDGCFLGRCTVRCW